MNTSAIGEFVILKEETLQMADNKKFWTAELMKAEVVSVIMVKQQPMMAKITMMIMTLGA